MYFVFFPETHKNNKTINTHLKPNFTVKQVKIVILLKRTNNAFDWSMHTSLSTYCKDLFSYMKTHKSIEFINQAGLIVVIVLIGSWVS